LIEAEMTTVQTMAFHAPDDHEESARGELYGVLATLFCAPPSQDLLDDIAAASVPGDGVLEQAWTELATACANADVEAVREEYEQMFIGVGKPEVLLYGSYYLSGFMMEKPLAALRTDLATLGLQRPESVVESEDHIAILCEVMRHLITSDEDARVDLGTQKIFFETHMQSWVADMCAAVETHAHANFYRRVARLAACFFEVEMQAFDMV
jgi:TorA maturation chaperone TorD